MATSKSSTKKPQKIDPKLVSQQPSEENYIQSRFEKDGKPPAIATVRSIHKKVGASRAKTYTALKEAGYTLKPYKRKPKKS